MEPILIEKLLMAAVALLSLGFIVKGLIDMQRVNTADGSVVETSGVVRQTKPHGPFRTEATLTINVEDEAVHIRCLVPGAWFKRPACQVTDLVPVFWRKGDDSAVATRVIRDGQRMFIVGFAVLALTALLYALVF